MSITEQALIQVVPGQTGCNGASQFTLGLAVVGGAIGRTSHVHTPDGRPFHPALNVVIASDSPGRLLASLHPLLAPLKFAQAKRHKRLAEMDPAASVKALADVKMERLAFEQSDPMPDPEHLAYFDARLLELQNATKPMSLLENPAAGRLTLALGKSADTSVLAVYDDLSLQGLLNAARMPRGCLDFEAMAKSNRQEIFDGAYLEQVLDAAVVSPTISTIMIATEETITKLLLSKDPTVAGFADVALIICESETTAPSGLNLPHMDPGGWKRIISRLLTTCAGQTRFIRLSKEAAQMLAGFEQQLMEERRHIPSEQGRFLDHLPRQTVKVAHNLHVSSDAPGDEITADEQKQAIELVQLSAKHRLALVKQKVQQDKVTFREKVRGIVSAADKPLSARDISRHIRDLKTATLTPILEELVEAGGLEEQDGKGHGGVRRAIAGYSWLRRKVVVPARPVAQFRGHQKNDQAIIAKIAVFRPWGRGFGSVSRLQSGVGGLTWSRLLRPRPISLSFPSRFTSP